MGLWQFPVFEAVEKSFLFCFFAPQWLWHLALQFLPQIVTQIARINNNMFSRRE